MNARKVEITWDEESLSHLLARRVADNLDFLKSVGVDSEDAEAMFASLLPAQVDSGSRRPQTWNWMMSRIGDGNYVRPPRNLIDLLKFTLRASVRREERDRSDYSLGSPVLHQESFKSGLSQLSKQRVEDTLLAEAGEQAPLVERFRGSKAEHNLVSLGDTLRLEDDALVSAVDFLTQIGFLEAVGGNYKVPMLYREGLGITQGKAFDPEAAVGEED